MAIYELTTDAISPLSETTFSVAELRERDDLQRLLRDGIGIVAPDTMVLTEEFGSWEDSRRRIDLLAVGRTGALVVETTVELDPDADPDLDHPTVELTACIDLSDTDIDADGHSVVPAERVDRVLVDYMVVDLGWPDEPMWRVVADDDHLTDTDPPEFVPCD